MIVMAGIASQGTHRSARGALLLASSLLVGLVLLSLVTLGIQAAEDPGALATAALDGEVASAIGITFGSAALAVGILALLGTPLAYLMSRTRSRALPLVEALVDLPLILPHTVAGLLVYLVFMRSGPLGSLLGGVGLSFEDAVPGIVAAMLFVGIPYYVGAARDGFAKVPFELEEVVERSAPAPAPPCCMSPFPLRGASACPGPSSPGGERSVSSPPW